ncbi:uncharacterized protein (TIGR02145 family) [Parabacteroides sp. PF5-5]|uniref:FISUMP domain-containing protein n=1 Tax=unclassified Parabacteroides TaxID=2649774 RepID=UPI0024766339|nr:MULTISPECIES: FISUMP domain-containing protein [unclassified Parabacteroides]MDH6304365.1 uncharacterized protein (TIGR02145 family) [Parabacteroides sp. PH5-39]MDH6315482.1 uncharacterized protein (TIGR02145 family) [Parabacteroides sp. PF5-13]MDH6319024.1 uncharacterized protein (TIGR02145 family) [Parabacteroides sp. PH5-13]MDH6322754.1 uncharacterized protein (TIGR02145 family) [Parabacteroides sp. PH5-8]MDH6326674.1 uncharacterized protein (TIGR02145 family) [Parabacteroides sp. PH5-41
MKTKHTKLTILLAALVLMLASSCNQEEFSNPPIKGERGGSITFRLQGKRQPVSYATIATQQENVVDSLEIYMFSDRSAESQPNLLQKVFRVGSTDLNQTNADLETTIDVTGRTGKHIFYFVANGKDNASSLANINVGATTEEDFRERLTDIQADLIKSPLLMTTRQEIVDIETPTADEKKVKLYRRVARFDVENDASDTNFTIGNILVENVKQQGYAFGDATGTPAQNLATGKHPMIENNDPADFNTGTPVASAFYLYPTKLADGQTVISFEGEFMGERRIYSLKSGTEIEANKRYILRVKKVAPNTPSLTIARADWEDAGGTYEAEAEEDDMEIGTFELTPNTGIKVTGKTYDITDATANATLTIPVKTYNKSGTRADVTYIACGESDLPGFKVESTTPILTYSAGYEQTHTITIPKVKKGDINIQVEIVNESTPEQRDTIHIVGDHYFPNTRLKPVVFGGVTWAPVNVGATEIGNSAELKHTGYYYQWGRNKGFVYGASGDTQPGPVTYDQGTTGIYKDKFILNANTAPFDWLSQQNHDLWRGANAQGPCPEGWRVPTKDEFELIKTAYGNAYNSTVSFTDNYLKIKGEDPGEILYIPAAGRRRRDTGNSEDNKTLGSYWSSEPGDEVYATRLHFGTSDLQIDAVSRSSGHSIRCVQD